MPSYGLILDCSTDLRFDEYQSLSYHRAPQYFPLLFWSDRVFGPLGNVKNRVLTLIRLIWPLVSMLSWAAPKTLTLEHVRDWVYKLVFNPVQSIFGLDWTLWRVWIISDLNLDPVVTSVSFDIFSRY